MSDIVAFIRARLTEQAQAARRAATDGAMDWRYESYYDHEDSATICLLSFGDHSMSADQGSRPDDDNPLTLDELRHIARHDPARVLRGVEADRAILEMFETAQLSVEVADGTPLAGATRLKAKTLRRVLAARAAQWSDHPDFDPSWSVDRG